MPSRRSTDQTPAFVGKDRRRAPTDAGLGPVFVVGSAAVAVAAVVAKLAPRPSRPYDVGLVLDTVTALAAVAVFAVCRARWRVVGESAPLWVGTGALVYGLVGVGLPNVIVPVLGGQGEPSTSTAAVALASAGLWVALCAFAVAAVAPEVDTRLRPLLLTSAAAILVAVLTVIFAAAPGLASRPVAAAMAGAVGTVHALRSLRRRWLYGWCGALLLALAVAEAVGGTPPGIAAQAACAAGFTAAVVGCALELGRAYTYQRSRLFDSEISLEAAAVAERLEATSRRTRRHDVRNAVLAIEGSAVTLERHVDRLSDADRAALSTVLSTGVERLQRLLRDEAGAGAVAVELAALAEGVAGAGEWDGRVTVDVPAELVAEGSASHTAEVLRILLDNAGRRAPGRPVVVAGRREGDWMVLQVRDQGTPVGRDERRAVAAADLGFLVAARLMRDQGGDLWVETDPKGGAFSLCLPAAGAASGTAPGAASGS